MARPPLSPKSASAASTRDKRTSALWRPRSISNLLQSFTKASPSSPELEPEPSPLSIPLPLSPPPAATANNLSFFDDSPAILSTRPLFSSSSYSNTNPRDSSPHAPSSGMLDNRPSSTLPPAPAPTPAPKYDACTDPTLRHSLALLEGAMQDLGGLSSPRLSRAEIELGWVAEGEEEDTGSCTEEEEGLQLEGIEVEVDPSERGRERKGSLARWQIPFLGEEQGQQQDFGQNMLWDALGLEPEDDDDSSLPYSRSYSTGLASISSIPSIHAAPPTTTRRELSHETTTSSFDDISEFPSYSDLTTFADHSPQLKDKNRSSDLLEFPIPPSEISPTRSEFQRAEAEEIHSPMPQSELSAEEAQVFERLAELEGEGRSALGRPSPALLGLGLFDSSAPNPHLAPTSEEERHSEDSNDFRSDHSSSNCTTSSLDHPSTRTGSSANTSFNLSKEEVATYHQAASLPHRFSGLPMPIATAMPPPPLPPADTSATCSTSSSILLPGSSALSTTPPLLAFASLQSLPEIFRTHPSPESTTVALPLAPVRPPPRGRSLSAKPLTVDTSSSYSYSSPSHSTSTSTTRSNSPITAEQQTFVMSPTTMEYPLPSPHQFEYDYSPPLSPGILVASMQRNDSYDQGSGSSSPTFSAAGGAAGVDSRSSSPSRSSSRQRSRDPSEMHMVSTDSLGLEGDNGMPLWAPSVEDSATTTTTTRMDDSAHHQQHQPRKLTKQPSSAAFAPPPRSPLAGPPVMGFLSSSSPPPPPPAPTAASRPLSAMGRRLSFLTLRKRKSEMTLDTLSSAKEESKPRMARRSVSTPRLSAAFHSATAGRMMPTAEEEVPPLPTSPTLAEFRPASIATTRPPVPPRRGSLPIEALLPTAPDAVEKENAPNLASHTTPTSNKATRKSRFSTFIFGGGSKKTGESAVPPLPLPLSISPPPPSFKATEAPLSAPPTTTAFSFAQFAMAPPSSGRTDTPTLDETDASASEPSTAGYPITPKSATTEGFFDYALLHSPFALQQREGQEETLIASSPRFYDEEEEEQVEDGRSSATPSAEEEREQVERLSLAAFIKSSPTPPLPPLSSPFDYPEHEQVKRPTRSSSFFSAHSTVFPSPSSRSATPQPFGESTNIVGAARPVGKDGKRAMSPMPFSTKALMDVGMVQDVEVRSARVEMPRVEEVLRRDAEREQDSGSEKSTSEDDKPLAVVIPGALKMQKSLRQESRRSSSKKAPSSSSPSATPSPQVDPFELEKLIASSARTPSPISPAAVGHSLLPQTDDAVERRSAAALTRSPSSPLDPLVANSTLTIDSPELKKQALRPVAARSATLPLASTSSSSSREPSPRRPSLAVDPSSPSSALSPPLRSPTLAPPRPTGRLPPLPSSGPSSRRPSQSAPSPAEPMQRQRSNTSSSSTGLRSSDMHRNLSVKSSSSPSPVTSPRLAPALPVTEHRIFVGDHTKRIVYGVSGATTAGEVVAYAKSKGALNEGSDAEGGWTLWEICRTLGVERPIREYELVADVVKSWDESSNILILKRTTLWPLLSSHLRPQPCHPRGGFVQLEMKKGKWSKRFLELKDGVVTHAKSEKGKDTVTLCQLASFEVFFVAPHVVDQLKAPKPFVFALKSRLPRAHYENQEEYCFFMSVKTAEDRDSWVKALIEARNVFARQQGSSSLPNSTNSSPALSSSSAFRPLLTPTTTPPLSRQPTLRPVPAILSTPSNSNSPKLDSSAPALKSPGALTKPDARTWAAMSEEQRQVWLKEAQREARERGRTLLDFRGEEQQARR